MRFENRSGAVGALTLVAGEDDANEQLRLYNRKQGNSRQWVREGNRSMGRKMQANRGKRGWL